MLNKVFRTALFLPYVYWFYLILASNLGAEPAKSLNHKTGKIALYYLIANLLLGVILAAKLRLPMGLRFIFQQRRWIGVVGFSFLIFHFALYLALEGFESKGFTQLYTKNYLILGLSAWILLATLAATSNNWSMKKLGGKNWKLLHRLVYVATALITAHILMIEKADLIFFGSLMSIVWLIQILRLIFLRKD